VGVLGLAAACGEPELRTLRTPFPPSVDLAGLLLTRAEGDLVASSPLTRLGPDRGFDAEFDVGTDAVIYVAGWDGTDWAPFLPDDAGLAAARLRRRRPGEAVLPAPEAVYRARPDVPIEPALPQELGDLTTDWAAGTCGPRPKDGHLAVDLDCELAPCLIDPETRPACADTVPLSCGSSTLRYVRDSSGRLTRVQLEGSLQQATCTPAPPPGPGVERHRCGEGQNACTVDLFETRNELDWSTQRMQLVDLPPRLEAFVRPPYGGYLEGPVPGAGGTAWVATHDRFVKKACGANDLETRLLHLGAASDGTLEILSSIEARRCIRLMRSDGREGFFAAYRGSGDRWRWGRFDGAGALVRSVQIVGSNMPSLTPSAAALVDGRWVIGLSDYRSRRQRSREDGNDGSIRAKSQVLAVTPDADAIAAGPVDVPFQVEGRPIFDVVEDGTRDAVIAMDDERVRRLSPRTLEPTTLDPSYRPVSRPRLREEPGAGVRVRTSPEVLLFLTQSGTRYLDEDLRIDVRGVVHVVRNRLGVDSRFFMVLPADPTAALPLAEDPDRALIGLVSIDRDAQPGQPPDIEGGLARFDVVRPGFEPEWHPVAPGPITGLVRSSDGAVWGISGWTGHVFRTELSPPD
jgi:hypothetical protein